MSLPRIRRHFNRRNRRLVSRSSSSQRSPLVIHTQRTRNRQQPLRERNHDEIVDVEAHTECIDLTSEEDIIDLTSPIQRHAPRSVNDSPVIVLAGRESVSPPRGRRRQRSQDIENEIEHHDIDNDLHSPDNTQQMNYPVNDVGSSSIGTVSSPGIRRITCPICMDDYKELQQSKVQLMSTVCGHLFCNPCIKAAVRANRQCPTCRRRLSANQIHPIFL